MKHTKYSPDDSEETPNFPQKQNLRNELHMNTLWSGFVVNGHVFGIRDCCPHGSLPTTVFACDFKLAHN